MKTQLIVTPGKCESLLRNVFVLLYTSADPKVKHCMCECSKINCRQGNNIKQTMTCKPKNIVYLPDSLEGDSKVLVWPIKWVKKGSEGETTDSQPQLGLTWTVEPPTLCLIIGHEVQKEHEGNHWREDPFGVYSDNNDSKMWFKWWKWEKALNADRWAGSVHCTLRHVLYTFSWLQSEDCQATHLTECPLVEILQTSACWLSFSRCPANVWLSAL